MQESLDQTGSLRNKFGIPVELVALEQERNVIPKKGITEEITVGIVERIHQAIQKYEDFTWGAGTIPGHIGTTQNQTNKELIEGIHQN